MVASRRRHPQRFVRAETSYPTLDACRILRDRMNWRKTRFWPTIAVIVLPWACGARTARLIGEDALVGDLGVPQDGGSVEDVSPAIDGGTNTSDDVRPARDVLIDIGRPLDVVEPADALTPMEMRLVGRWRAYEYRFRQVDGGGFLISNGGERVPNPDGGASSVLSVNGVLQLNRGRMSLSFATLVDRRVRPFTQGRSDDLALGALGYTAAGSLMSGGTSVFRTAGGGREFDLGDGGDHITWHDPISSDYVYFYPVPASAARNSISVVGTIQQIGRLGRLAAPRAALQWDLPGDGQFRTTSDSPLSLAGGPPEAEFPVEFSDAPPAALRGSVGGVAVASAYLLVYDDRNGNGSYDRDPDDVLTQSTLGLAWRGDGEPSAEFVGSGFADLQRGWQVVHYHREIPSGRWALAPFDNDAPISLRAVIEEHWVPGGVELH